jgi:tetratricopeptide (TPR) repeat protein
LDKATSLDPANRDNYYSVDGSPQGWAYTRLGRYEDAISAFKRDRGFHPDLFWVHLGLAIDDIEASPRQRRARAEAAKVFRLNPQFSLERLLRTTGPKGKVQAQQVRWVADLRKAGLS